MPSRGPEVEAFGVGSDLWDAANQIRSNAEPSNYKHVVLGLIFLKYVSGMLVAKQAALAKQVQDPSPDLYVPIDDARATLIEDRDLYAAAGVFSILEGPHWTDLKAAAKQPDIGQRQIALRANS